MSFECCVFTVGIVIQLASISAWYQFAIGRFVSGLGVGALSAAVPLYQAETGRLDINLQCSTSQTDMQLRLTAPKAIRGTLTATYQLFITAGILVAYCFSIGTRETRNASSWRIVVGLSLVSTYFLSLTMMKCELL